MSTMHITRELLIEQLPAVKCHRRMIIHAPDSATAIADATANGWAESDARPLGVQAIGMICSACNHPIYGVCATPSDRDGSDCGHISPRS